VQGEYTPFLVACEYKKLNLVKFLMEKIPVEKLMEATCYKDCAGISALHLAAKHDDKKLFEYLLTKLVKCKTSSNGDEGQEVDLEKEILLNTRDNRVRWLRIF